MTWWDWNEWVYTHGNSASVEVFIEGPRFQTEGVSEEKLHLSQSTPNSCLLTVQWLVGGQVSTAASPHTFALPFPTCHRQNATERES